MAMCGVTEPASEVANEVHHVVGFVRAKVIHRRDRRVPSTKARVTSRSAVPGGQCHTPADHQAVTVLRQGVTMSQSLAGWPSPFM